MGGGCGPEKHVVGIEMALIFHGVGRFRAGIPLVCLLAWGLAGGTFRLAWGQLPAPQPDAAPAETEVEEADDSGGVSLPTDRLKERQLDRVRRLIADSRWSDAATLLDEILGGDRDFFFRPDQGDSTWRSIKTDANRLLAALPPQGREAYELQFRARAERELEQAIARADRSGVVAVARRWFHTPAGRRATMMAALESLEGNQPLEAAAWLDRLQTLGGGEAFEPTLSVMRAVAWWRAGEREAAMAALDRVRAGRGGQVRLGGKDVGLSYAPGGAAAWLAGIAGEPAGAQGRRNGEWLLPRGDAARNALVASTRPLLVPRYRVPLTRHPEEARLLEKRRKQFADREMPLLPAGSPLAVGGSILVHSPMGLLAIDFETGKRVWLQTGGAAASFVDALEGNGDDMEGREPSGAGALRGVFDDATSGMLSSDGRLVFAVESDPAELSGSLADGGNGIRRGLRGLPAAGRTSNVLSAYDVAEKGTLRWRLPAPATDAPAKPAEGGRAPEPVTGGGWFLGAPLPIGDQLFVLVEERGEVRLDVLTAATGALLWTQPLAELDEERAIDNRDGQRRRLAGLSPSFADGVLVCPTGAGTVVSVDLATRTLLWAYNYPQPGESDAVLLPNGVLVRRGNMLGGGMGGRIIINGQLLGGAAQPASGWRDSAVILAGGRAILTPRESDELHCLDLRSGAVAWKVPRKESLYVAGVREGSVVVVGRSSVESLSLENGRSQWDQPLDLEGARPSGRGIVTAERLFLPLDTPEVIEVDLRSGLIAGRSAARGGAVAGNLLAYRGEVVSQGVESLDVFHQTDSLKERIETAKRVAPDAWGLFWLGQMELDRGDVANGLAHIRAAHAADPASVPADVMAQAMLCGMQRDFAAAAPLWREVFFTPQPAGPLVWSEGVDPTRKAMLRVAVDGSMKAGAFPEAWEVCRHQLDHFDQMPAAVAPSPAPLWEDPSDPLVAVTEDRWMQGRLLTLWTAAPAGLRAEIDRAVEQSLAATQALSDRATQVVRWDAFLQRFAWHPAAGAARQGLIEASAALLAATEPGSDAARDLELRREFAQLAAAEGSVAAVDPAAWRETAAAWPFGQVVEQRSGDVRASEEAVRQARMMSIAVDDHGTSFFPGLRLAYDMQQPGLVATDGYGRRIGDPFGFEGGGRLEGLVPMFQPMATEASAVGRVVVVRSGPLLAAFELTGQGGGRNRRLWMLSDAAGGAMEMPAAGMGRFAAGRAGRIGNVPLGMRIGVQGGTEEMVPIMAVQGGQLRATGVPVLVHSSLALHDPVSGAVRWERQRLPASGEVIADDDYVCVCPADGRGAVVVSMADGRLVRTCDVPRRELRVLTSGRRMVAIVPPVATPGEPGAATPQNVQLELFDPVTLTKTPLGTYGPLSRVAPAGPGHLAVVDPAGAFTVVDLEAQAVRFQVVLPEMPKGLEQLRVIPWQDRFLVFVGRQETPEERKMLEKVGMITTLPQQASSRDNQPVSGSLWAVGRDSGDMLWPVPATLLRHCLHVPQAAELPVLLFARQIQPARGGDRPRLSVLALDKRTGHAVCLDDKINAQPHMLFGCDMTGDPGAHTITLRRGGSEVSDIVLEFTGRPMAPSPPFQAAGRLPVTRDILSELEYWFEKTLQFSLPF